MPAIVIDQAHWAQLEQVQLKVDGKVVFTTDDQRFGKADYWEAATKQGDCEDMALAKRDRLMKLGWPPEDLRIAMVIDERGELHAVLTVDVMSAKGAPATYVLDNRFLHVETWKHLSDYGYTWVERAKPGSTQWTRLEAGGAAAAQFIAVNTQIQIIAPAKSVSEALQAAPQPQLIKAIASEAEIAAPLLTVAALNDSLEADLPLASAGEPDGMLDRAADQMAAGPETAFDLIGDLVANLTSDSPAGVEG